MYEMGEQLERVILAGVQTYDSDDTGRVPYGTSGIGADSRGACGGKCYAEPELAHIPLPIWGRESWRS